MAEITDVRRQLKFPVNRLGTDLAVQNSLGQRLIDAQGGNHLE